MSATVAGWIGLAFVFALVLELTCRIEDWVTYRAPLFSTYTSINDLVVRDSDGMHGRPNARYLKWAMNGLGTRGPAASVTPAPGTVRVITVGASETFGLRESPGREYPRQLEDSLNARLARGECRGTPPRKYEVLNAGFPGMGLPTVDQDLRIRLPRLKPAIVVVYPTPAQYLQDEVPFAPPPDSAAHPSAPPLSQALRPRTFDRMHEQIKQVLPEWLKTRLREIETREMVHNQPKDWRFTSIPPERLAAFEADLRHVIGTIHKIGAVPVLVTHGNMFMGRQTQDQDEMLVAWEKFYPRATGRTIMAFDTTARTVTLRIGADSGVTTIDAAKQLETVPVSAFGDFVHFTDLGSSHMAKIVSEGVLSATSARGICVGAATSISTTGGTQ